MTEERRFKTQGQATDAVVLSKSVKPASREDNSGTRYEIAYRYTTQDGGTIEKSDAVAVELWESAEKGRRIRIVYLPDEPEWSRLENSSGMESSLAAVGLGSIFALVGGFFFLKRVVEIGRQGSILRSGDVVQATGTAIAPTNVEVNNVRQWEVRYQYQDHFGRTHEGASEAAAPAEAGAAAVGDNIRVRFDRERPEQSVWEQPEMMVADAAAKFGSSSEARRSFWRQLGGFARMLALVLVVIILGEVIAERTGLDQIIARHEDMLWRRPS